MYIGKYVNTHGIKGEIKIQSDVDHKDAVFKIGNEISIASKTFKIKTYRVHKGYDMLTFEGINNINDILPLKGNKVFIDRNLLPEEIIFYNDLINKTLILDDKIFGKVVDYSNTKNPLLICIHDEKTFYIPMNGNFIKEIKDDIFLEESAKGLIL